MSDDASKMEELMSQLKPDAPEIPAAMLDVAAKVVLEVAVLFARIAELETQYGEARKLLAVRTARIVELETELAKFQTSKFHPDWPVLEATQEGLRESWARIRELESALRPFAEMDRDGCDLFEIVLARGVASDITIVTNSDFRRASEAMKSAESAGGE